MNLLGLDVTKYWTGEEMADQQEDNGVPEAKRFKQDTALEQVV